MIKATDIQVESVKNGIKYVRASLYADTQQEILDMGTDVTKIDNISDKYVLVAGTTAFNGDLSFGILNSNNSWTF